MGIPVGVLGCGFAQRNIGDRFVGPNLSVRVRVRCPHGGAAVFKNLYVGDAFIPGKLGVLGPPEGYDIRHLGVGHIGDVYVMLRGIAEHPAGPVFAVGTEHLPAGKALWFGIRAEGGEVVLEDKRLGVLGSNLPVGAAVSRA